ncbi:MAG: hypothetical protein IPH50_06135 [Rhodanobacteraceae bacterium]|nr:hypothetical protein [Rhodanobacteraceae bacterium]
MNLELSNNLYADPGFTVWYNRDVDQNAADGPYRVHLNLIGNQFLTRANFPYAMYLFDLLDVSSNTLFTSGNRLSIYPSFADYQLFYCCNDFPDNAPNTALGTALRRTDRHPFPTVSYLSDTAVQIELPVHAGALPQDPLNRRWRQSTLSGIWPAVDYGTALANDTFDLDFNPALPPPAPADSDSDGMPDGFELANGLNPAVADGNGNQLSLAFTGVLGYTNLECYLNALADSLLAAPAIFVNSFE